MDRSPTMAVRRGGRADRLARSAERWLRLVGDPRLGLGLLLLAGLWNALAAALPRGGWLLDTPAYLVLLGAVLLTGLAGVAVRGPAVWREWRRPAPLAGSDELISVEIALDPATHGRAQATAVATLRRAGYRVIERGEGRRWSAAGVRRGWARFAGLGSHLALILLVLGAALGTAFSSETTFSLLPGEQALLDAPRPGFTDALRLDRFDAAFGPDGRPARLDTTVTFLRDGEPVSQQLVQVNRPGEFGGYLVHGWTYGPAARLRVTTLGGQPLLDAPIALDGTIAGQPAAFAELPTAGLTLGLTLVDPIANELAVGVAGGSGLLDAVRLRPGDQERVGSVIVRHAGFEAYVTFLSRRDPGMGVLFAGAAVLILTLAVALWLPRRRATLLVTPQGLRLSLRGERLDRPTTELADLSQRIASAVEAVA
ncbi:MAG TPA: cytochrome c biogenesis protein ResB [Candidatus Dormibacteraeota bacterium]|nr:cytochrome c biogenesis protein ResB [Candidatus Dormibacteraeota bacterium]